MRETKNLKLTQFDPNDIPNWLDQYNSDMEKIDSEVGRQDVVNTGYETRFENNEEKIQNNRNQINENVQDIANIKDDVKNIKGGSTVSIADLKEEVDVVEHSLTILKGDSDKTIDDIENDVSELKNKVGTDSTSNFGDDLSKAIGNSALESKLSGKSISEVLNFLTTNSIHLEGQPDNTQGLSVNATIDLFPISKFFAVGIISINATADGGGATISEGTQTRVAFNMDGNKIPNAVPSNIYLGDLYDILPPEQASTCKSASLTFSYSSGNAVINTNIHSGTFILSPHEKITNYKIPVIIPCYPLA